MMLVCVIVSGHLVGLITLAKWWVPGFFTVKFELIGVLWGDISRLCKYPVSYQLSPTEVLLSIGNPCLINQLLL